MEWRDGLMPQGVREGYIVLIDEVMKIPSGIQMALQNLYEEKGYLMLDDKPGTVEEKKVIPAPSFRMILTDNAKGTGDNFDKFAGTQVQDTSTIDRFGITAEVPYLPSVDETAMLAMKYPAMPVDEIARIVQFANLVRNGYIQSSLSLTLSPRGLQTICELFADIPNVPQCVKMTYLSKLGDTEEQDAVHEMFKTIW
jgi:cobaltochelatase CobS